MSNWVFTHCRPYVYAVHSEQPDTFGHKLGPHSNEVSWSEREGHGFAVWRVTHLLLLPVRFYFAVLIPDYLTFDLLV